jgi:dGTPase
MIKTAKDLQKEIYGKLAEYAVQESKGRLYKEPDDFSRLPFQLDRDRIIHCKAFRRLDEKTQVFTASYGDHFRTRLTHTMEVAQISRDIARTFAVNEDLAEAIALAHDLGHPPFGHAGEDALNEIMGSFGLHFEHNEQSRRVVEKLEKLYPDFDGLNLTIEVLEGLIKHKTSWDNPQNTEDVLPSVEAKIVNLADEIAYTNHDIDDGLRSGLFGIKDLEKLKLWQKATAKIQERFGMELKGEVKQSRFISTLIHLMILDLYKNSKMPEVQFSSEMEADIKEMREFLVENFYFTDRVQSQLLEGKKIIKTLFDIYVEDPSILPEKIEHRPGDKITLVKDYVAGMTDGFAKKEYERLVKNRN